jgi:hypothetical protein
MSGITDSLVTSTIIASHGQVTEAIKSLEPTLRVTSRRLRKVFRQSALKYSPGSCTVAAHQSTVY